jgi:hypothetical protein
MNGQVYRLPIRGHTQSLPHPHVVLIELEKECWLIPAFGDDGPEIQGLIAACVKMGYNAADVAVHMDNGAHVKYLSGFPGIKAYWAVARALKATKTYLRTCDLLGQMDDEGVLLLARAADKLSQARPDFISPSLQKKIRKLIETLSARLQSQSIAPKPPQAGMPGLINPSE